MATSKHTTYNASAIESDDTRIDNESMDRFELRIDLVPRPCSQRKKAMITGITGQDGSYLAELLLEKVGTWGCRRKGTETQG
jgi:hypothetical protein